jgi:hypothetical protein
LHSKVSKEDRSKRLGWGHENAQRTSHLPPVCCHIAAFSTLPSKVYSEMETLSVHTYSCQGCMGLTPTICTEQKQSFGLSPRSPQVLAFRFLQDLPGAQLHLSKCTSQKGKHWLILRPDGPCPTQPSTGDVAGLELSPVSEALGADTQTYRRSRESMARRGQWGSQRGMAYE